MWLKGVAGAACLADVQPARWAASALEDAAPVTCRLKRLHAAEPAGCAQALGKEFRVVRRQPVRERRRLYGAAAESVCTRAKPGGTAETTPGWRGVLSSRTVRQEHIITRTAHVRRFQMSRTALAVTPYLAASCTHSRQCRCTCTARRRFRRPSRLAHVTCIHSTVIAAKRSRAPRHSGSSDQVAAAGLLTQQDARQADAWLARSRKCTHAWHTHLAASRAGSAHTLALIVSRLTWSRFILKISAAPSAVRAVVSVAPTTWSCSASDDASVDGDRPGSGGMLAAQQAGIGKPVPSGPLLAFST